MKYHELFIIANSIILLICNVAILFDKETGWQTKFAARTMTLVMFFIMIQATGG